MNDDHLTDVSNMVSKELEKEWNEYVQKHQEATKEALESIKSNRVGQSEGDERDGLKMEDSSVLCKNPKCRCKQRK
jgi:hypothetical protein